MNYQPGPNTPGFLSEATRFAYKPAERTLQNKCDFQAEDKQRRERIQASNVRAKQQNAEMLQTRIQLADQEQLAKQTTRILTKAANNDTYEKLNHF